MSIKQSFLGGAPAAQLYVDDVFSTYLYTGNGSTQTITNGIDLAGEGGSVWTKCRGATAESNRLVDSARGVSNSLCTNDTNQQFAYGFGHSFLSNGFSFNTSDGSINDASKTYASWTFRNAPNFYHHTVVTKSAGSNATFNFSMHDKGLGMVRVKRTDSTGSWYIWHRSLSAGKLLIGETTAAETTLGHITVSGTTVTLVDGVIADGAYLVEAFGHDTSADGIIQCGSFTTDGSGNATVNPGWEPQFLQIKRSSGVEGWTHLDSMRGFSVSGGKGLAPNSSSVEYDFGSATYILKPTATGFASVGALSASSTYIYLAIRRPNKPPTSGTEVYNAIAYAGSGSAIQSLTNPFSPDIGITNPRDTAYEKYLCSRLRGSGNVFYTNYSSGVAQEQSSVSGIKFDGSDKVLIDGTLSYVNGANGLGYNYVVHVMRRAVTFMDEICFSGSGANKTEAHGLGVAPELWFVRRRNGQGGFYWGSVHIANTDYLKAANNSTTSKTTDATVWNSTYPTASVISLGSHSDVNASGGTYDCVMWATVSGISKVGTYAGNGSTQTINCGFATGARYVQIFRTDAAGNIFTFDTARGIVAGNDPFIRINLSNVESAGYDAIDPDNSGFIVNNDGTNFPINVNGATYIYLAIA